jgi:S1-C subfamily serine protease
LNDSSDTAAISFANSDDARIGKKLIAIGNAPAAYQNRLALGTLGNIDHTFNLSSSSKTVASSEKWEGVFEMDFGTPGDFVGGPAVDFNGEMLGVIGSVSFNNTMRTFVIPANTVHDSLKKAIAGTLSDRPVLGVYYRSVTDTLALSEGLPRSVGALIAAPSAVGGKAVAAILADSPASRAGLQAGDIIESVGGTDIDLEHPLSQLVGNYTKGSQVDFRILRNGEEKTVTVGL